MSDTTVAHVIEASGSGDDLLAALRQALIGIAKAAQPKGIAPPAFIDMTWTCRRPAAIHPAAAVVDLSYRESFGAFKPPLTVTYADHDGVRVTVRARQTASPPIGKAWGDFTFADLAREYSPRAYVSDMTAIFESWRTAGAAFRAKHLVSEIAYGPAASETFDLYLPANVSGRIPLWVFIHGGYWQAVDKSHQGQFAAGMLASGYAVAVPNYTLAPAATVHSILAQMQMLLRFLSQQAAALGCDANEIHIAGHSAGGQLVAMLACLPEAKLIRSALPLSGVFDLAPLAKLPFGKAVGLLSDDDVAQLSPLVMRPASHVRVGAAVGGAESNEFQRQTAAFARAWGVPSLIATGRHHFDLLDDLNGGALLQFAKDIARCNT